MVDYQVLRLEEIQSDEKYAFVGGPFGSKLVSKDYKENGVPVIRGTNLSGDSYFNFDDFVFVSEEKADDLIGNNAYPGDLVFTQRGTLGQIGIIPNNSQYSRFVISQSQMKLTVNQEKADPYYLYYYFRSPSIVKSIENRAISSGVPHINLETLRNFEVSLPPLTYQCKVAAILSAYDDLIENNTRRIAILEEMAQLIYREWFVHFRFPGHENVQMIDSELGAVPEGWEVKQLKDFGEIVLGKTPPRKDPENFGIHMPFVRIPDMRGNVFAIETEEGLSEKGVDSQSKKTLPANSLCVSCIGSAGLVAITSEPSQTNQQINTIVPDNALDREYLYFALSDLEETIKRYGAIGATMVNLSKGKFQRLKVIYPSAELVERYHNLTQPLFAQILVLQKKNINLRETRDLLLPRLVSGELDVSEVKVMNGVGS